MRLLTCIQHFFLCSSTAHSYLIFIFYAVPICNISIHFQRIPDMSLPESAASTDPELSSSVPFGSLRESKFAHPGFGFERMPDRSQQQSTNNFLPQSLPAYGGIGSYFPLNNNNSSRNSSQSGIGSLIEESDELKQSHNESVSGISQAMDYGLQLNEHEKSYGPGGLSTAVYHQPLQDGPSSNNLHSAPLSSSLTALDILTQIRQSPGGGLKAAPRDNRNQADDISWPQESTNQQLEKSPPMSSAHEDDNIIMEDHNPDTFEAFDFELDG